MTCHEHGWCTGVTASTSSPRRRSRRCSRRLEHGTIHVRGVRSPTGSSGAAPNIAGRAPGRGCLCPCLSGSPAVRAIVTLSAGAALMVTGRVAARRGPRSPARRSATGGRRRRARGGSCSFPGRRLALGAVSAVVAQPASSANLGPGSARSAWRWGCTPSSGLSDSGTAALTRPTSTIPPRSRSARRVASAPRVRSSIPIGRGMGYSGAVRVGGLVAAHLPAPQPGRGRTDRGPAALAQRRKRAGGHADNAAASIFGGVVAAAAGRAVRIPMPFDPTAVLWAPASTTSTRRHGPRCRRRCRSRMRSSTSRRTALLVAALAAGDVAAPERDRRSDAQSLRFSPLLRRRRVALEAALAAGVVWLVVGLGAD